MDVFPFRQFGMSRYDAVGDGHRTVGFYGPGEQGWHSVHLQMRALIETPAQNDKDRAQDPFPVDAARKKTERI